MLRLVLKRRLHGPIVFIHVAMDWVMAVAVEPVLKRVGAEAVCRFSATFQNRRKTAT